MTQSIDVIGDIAIIRFPEKTSWLYKKIFAIRYLWKNKEVHTVLEKGKIRGRLRKFSCSFLAGTDKRETIHKENLCSFFLNVEKTYFSPRLSNERKYIGEEISKIAKSNPRILVMFAGVAPFPIVLAKILKSSKKKAKIYSSEINQEATRYAQKNVSLNKMEDYITVLQGDSRKIHTTEKFDFILMTRPNLKESFLANALRYSKRGTIIYYYGFGTLEKVLDEVKNKKVKKIYSKKAGDIAPKLSRWLVKLKVR
jgi:tRNA (guanine37-N1)-methyltransferase